MYSRNIVWSKHKTSKQHFVFSPVLFPPPNTVDFIKQDPTVLLKGACRSKGWLEKRCLY